MSISKAIIEEIDVLKKIVEYHQEYFLNGKQNLPWDYSFPTVMLLHGYFVGAPSMHGLANHLEEKGFNTSCENYAFWKNLEKVELEVGENLDRICQKVGDKVKLIGHSEGGLVAYALGKRFPEKVDKVISLGAPFQGTIVAYLNYFVPGAKDMALGSFYLQELQEKDFPEEVSFFSLYSLYDQVVIPADSSILPTRRNVKNICVDNVCHAGLIGEKSYGIIEKILNNDD